MNAKGSARRLGQILLLTMVGLLSVTVYWTMLFVLEKGRPTVQITTHLLPSTTPPPLARFTKQDSAELVRRIFLEEKFAADSMSNPADPVQFFASLGQDMARLNLMNAARYSENSPQAFREAGLSLTSADSIFTLAGRHTIRQLARVLAMPRPQRCREVFDSGTVNRVFADVDFCLGSSILEAVHWASTFVDTTREEVFRNSLGITAEIARRELRQDIAELRGELASSTMNDDVSSRMFSRILTQSYWWGVADTELQLLSPEIELAVHGSEGTPSGGL